MRLSLQTILVVAAALLSLTCFDAFGQTNGLPPDVKTALENADTFTLYSVDPDPDYRNLATNTFQRHIILGQLDVQSKATIAELIDAMDKGIIAAGHSAGARCFNPRHAIRATKDGETVELLICFECGQIYITSHSRTNQFFPTTTDPTATFNKVLKDAGILVAGDGGVYYVGGEVMQPGPKLYLGYTTVTKAIQAAGGFTPFSTYFVWLRRTDGTRILVDVNKALKDPSRDPQVFPEDQIYAKRPVY